eukprot:scaffold3683_cov118-Isochrysis_galbana.AAC.8
MRSVGVAPSSRPRRSSYWNRPRCSSTLGRGTTRDTAFQPRPIAPCLTHFRPAGELARSAPSLYALACI